MIFDHLDPSCPSELNSDICIVGAGAAGLVLAVEFMKTSLRVVLLESGGWEFEQPTQDLYNTEQTAKRFESAHSGRFRILGGSTTRWGGQSFPLMPIDFEQRSWVNYSGWPINYDGLKPYYDRANRFLGVDTKDYKDETATVLGMELPDLDPSILEFYFGKWAPQPDLRQSYCGKLKRSENVTLILHANVTELEIESSRVARVRYRSLEGRDGVVRAKVFIIATGGIEVPRLLLASNRQLRHGLGNEHDMVGRFLQEHPAVRLGVVAPINPELLQSFFNGRRAKGQRFSARLSLSRPIQEKERLLNASAAFLFSLPSDRGFGLLRAIAKRQVNRAADATPARVVSEAIKCLPDLVKAAWFIGWKGRIFTPGATCELAASFEQEPDPESRVTLSDQKDALGIPLSRIHWKISPKTFKTAVAFAGVIDHELRRLRIGYLKPHDWLRHESGHGNYEDYFNDQNHHIGTARMSISPRDGVVDPSLKVHSLSNLYITSSATFPTGGHSNPTLTILALAIRLADDLKMKSHLLR